MKDEDKKKEQLLNELEELRQTIAELGKVDTERKETEENLIKRTEVLNAINEVLRERIKCGTEEELGKICLAVAEKLTSSRFGFFGELNSDGLFDTIAISNPGWDACNVPEDKARLVIKNMPITGIDRSTMREEKSRIVNGEEAFAKHPDHVVIPKGHPKLTAFLGVPLKEDGKTIGMIGLGNKEGGYSLGDQENIEALSVAMVEALKSKRAEDKIQSQIMRFNILRWIEMSITSTLALNDTLDILLNQITTQLGLDAAAVLLLNKQTQKLEYVVSKGFRSDALKYTRLKIGEEGSYAGRAAFERSIINISNLKEDINGFIRSKLFTKEDFISYFAVPLVVKNEVKGVLELFHRSMLIKDPEWLEFLEIIADQAAIAIYNAFLFKELTNAYDTTIEGWSRALDMRDKETEGHSQRVTDMAVRIATEMGIIGEKLVHMRRGALLHDIGKMGIPDYILLKPEPLTDEEWKTMKRHSEYAYNMLYPIEYLRDAIDIPYYHHERWDGKGYPRGLKGEEIPLAARIFAVVDLWDALNSDRPYRPAWKKEKVLKHIRSLAGTHLDPKVVEVFLKMKLL